MCCLAAIAKVYELEEARYISCIVKTEAEKIEKQGSAYEIWTTILFIIYVFKNIF